MKRHSISVTYVTPVVHWWRILIAGWQTPSFILQMRKVEAKKVMWLEFDHSYLVVEMDLEPVLVWWFILSVPLTEPLTFYNRVFLLYGNKDSVFFKLLADFSKPSTWKDSKFALSELEKSSDIISRNSGSHS